jgi:hypothetical protein
VAFGSNLKSKSAKVFSGKTVYLRHHRPSSFGNPVPKDLRSKLLKRTYTAINFEARQTAKDWLDASGNWTNVGELQSKRRPRPCEY